MNEDKPALLGGAPSVKVPPPHFVWPEIGPEHEQAVLAQLKTGELSYYRNAGVVKEFERAFADYHGAPYAVSTHSGTGSLHTAYFGLGLRPGDEVIAPAYTHLGTVFPMLHCGLIPRLCDVDESTGNIDPDKAAAIVEKRTRAIVVTHQYGHVCDMDAIMELARDRGLYVVEDCSHAHGATYKGKPAGSFGDAGCFSLQSHKTVFAGEGGILITWNKKIAERASLLGHFREKREYTSPELEEFVETGYGLKNRLHPLAAAVALASFKNLEKTIAARSANYEYLCSRLEEVPGLEPLPTAPAATRGGFFRFILKYDPEKFNGLPVDGFIEAMHEEGAIEIKPGHLARPLAGYSFFQKLDDGMYPDGWPRRGSHVDSTRLYKEDDFPAALRFSNSTLQLPPFTRDSKDIIAEYVEAMKKISRHSKDICARQKIGL